MEIEPNQIAIVIDDDPIFRKAAESILTYFKITPLVTDNVKTFFKLSKQKNPDLYLIDLNLGAAGSGLRLTAMSSGMFTLSSRAA